MNKAYCSSASGCKVTKILFTFQIFLQKVWSFTIFAYICTIKPIVSAI